MIIRLVKMTFRPEAVAGFLTLFNERKELIRHFNGCSHLELLEDKGDSTVYFTYSYWDSEQSLQQYRDSALFKDTWQLTKALFQAKAEAWTVDQKIILP